MQANFTMDYSPSFPIKICRAFHGIGIKILFPEVMITLHPYNILTHFHAKGLWIYKHFCKFQITNSRNHY
jgi:hypothetical protein